MSRFNIHMANTIIDTKTLNDIDVGVNGLVKYLEHIDVRVNNVERRLSDDYPKSVTPHHSNSGCIYAIHCRASQEIFKYLEYFATSISFTDIPVLNKDAVISHDLSLSMFDMERHVNFTIQLGVSYNEPLEALDRFLVQLKEQTKDLLWRKFSESVDEEITEELGE